MMNIWLNSTISKKNKIENCEYQVLDIEKNLPPDTFDRIVSFEVIEHLNQEDGLAFYYKALKNKGKSPFQSQTNGGYSKLTELNFPYYLGTGCHFSHGCHERYMKNMPMHASIQKKES